MFYVKQSPGLEYEDVKGIGCIEFENEIGYLGRRKNVPLTNTE